MTTAEMISAVLVDEAALTLDELARACGVEQGWVVRHVEAGALGSECSVDMASWRFGSGDLGRARRLLRIERAFDAGDELAALVVDLSDEVRRLRARLNALGG